MAGDSGAYTWLMEDREFHSQERTLEILTRGSLELQGLVPWSSNYTFLVSVCLADAELTAVYKPQEGERPLWDFDSGTLYRREVAAYLLSRQLGWPHVPPVVAREDGPYGPGSVQAFIESDRLSHFFTLRSNPKHADALQRIALFDVIANNADRKGGHVLAGADGRIWAIDHGLTFHETYKLRTVIWDWAGQPVPAERLEDVEALHRALQKGAQPRIRCLQALITPREWRALLERIESVLDARALPQPRRNVRNVPYPLI